MDGRSHSSGVREGGGRTRLQSFAPRAADNAVWFGAWSEVRSHLPTQLAGSVSLPSQQRRVGQMLSTPVRPIVQLS